MFKKKMPPSYGDSFCSTPRVWVADGQNSSSWPGAGCSATAAGKALTGPMMVDCQWKRSSPTGPALQVEGGSFARSASSLLIRLVAEPAMLKRGLTAQGRADADERVGRQAGSAGLQAAAPRAAGRPQRYPVCGAGHTPRA